MDDSLRRMLDESQARERVKLAALTEKMVGRTIVGIDTSSEGTFTLTLDSGDLIEVVMYAYPEGAFMEVDGHHLPLGDTP
jgi:hypothetical protein